MYGFFYPTGTKLTLAPAANNPTTNEVNNRRPTTARITRITLRTLAAAVAKAEGFTTPGSIAQQRNNPCNSRAKGDLGKSGGFGRFSTVEKGYQSCEKTLRFYISRGRTLQQTINYFSPRADHNNPVQHADNIAIIADIDKNVPLKDLITNL